MERKYILPLITAVLVGGALWLGRWAWRTDTFDKSSVDVGLKTPGRTNSDPGSVSLPKVSRASLTPGTNNGPKPGKVLRPPVPNRRFTDFTPEQRVEFARKGRGPGG